MSGGREQPRGGKPTGENKSKRLREKVSGEEESEGLRPGDGGDFIESVCYVNCGAGFCSSEEGADSRGPKLFGRAGGETERHDHASGRDPCNVQDLTSTVRGGEAQGVPPLPGNIRRGYLSRVISLAELASTVYPRPKQAQAQAQ